jgi:putative FmdB family regulatory protein
MPTYSYHCDACNRDFEKEQRISEPALKKCALCGKSKARRMIASGNFILKGGGWYSDGYGSGSGKSKSSESKSSDSSPAPSTSSSSSSSSSSSD